MRYSSSIRSVRRGYGLVEVAISSLILAAALSLTLVGLSRIVNERVAVARRQRASQEAANALERFLALPWSARTADTAKAFTLDEPARKRLPNGILKVEVNDEPGPPAGRKVTVTVAWGVETDRGSFEPPARLVAWTYPAGGRDK